MDVYIYVIPAPAQPFRISSQLFGGLLRPFSPNSQKVSWAVHQEGSSWKLLDYKNRNDIPCVEERADMSLSDNPTLAKSPHGALRLPPGFFFLFSRLASWPPGAREKTRAPVICVRMEFSRITWSSLAVPLSQSLNWPSYCGYLSTPHCWTVCWHSPFLAQFQLEVVTHCAQQSSEQSTPVPWCKGDVVRVECELFSEHTGSVFRLLGLYETSH